MTQCSRCGKQGLTRKDLFRLKNGHLVGIECVNTLSAKAYNNGQPLNQYFKQTRA